jgi:hypothetical protein
MYDFSDAASERYGASDYGREGGVCRGCDRLSIDCLCPADKDEDDGRCRKCNDYTDDCECEREEEEDL